MPYVTSIRTALSTPGAKVPHCAMDVPHSNFAAHQHLQIFSAHSPVTRNQTWSIISQSDGVPLPTGYINILAGAETHGLCIDVPHSSTAPGTLVQLYPLNQPGGTPNQQWKLIPATGIWVYIASALDNNLVLDVRGGDSAPGTLIQLYTVGDNQLNQLWFLTNSSE